MMQLYTYTAIISKATITQGKVTYVDKRSMSMGLDSRCVQGHVLADRAKEAEVSAIKEVKRTYPEEQGYKDHENVTVQFMEETVI